MHAGATWHCQNALTHPAGDLDQQSAFPELPNYSYRVMAAHTAGRAYLSKRLRYWFQPPSMRFLCSHTQSFSPKSKLLSVCIS